jgi:hypothetical protein
MLTSLSLSYIYTQQAGEGLFEDGIEASESAPFEDLGTVLPEEINPNVPQTDPFDTTGDDAAIAEPTAEDAGAADENP